MEENRTVIKPDEKVPKDESKVKEEKKDEPKMDVNKQLQTLEDNKVNSCMIMSGGVNYII
jgi:hypothetical protein